MPMPTARCATGKTTISHGTCFMCRAIEYQKIRNESHAMQKKSNPKYIGENQRQRMEKSRPKSSTRMRGGRGTSSNSESAVDEDDSARTRCARSNTLPQAAHLARPVCTFTSAA